MDSQVLPTPHTTLAILLGASAWPRWQELDSSEAFVNSVQGMKDYLLDPHKFALPQENLLDLFNAEGSADDIDYEINQFLNARITEMAKRGQAARDILIYFTGHAGFVRESLDYYLAIRRTRKESPDLSGLPITSLANTIKENTRHLRRVLILDCCYAASAFGAFQGDGIKDAAIKQTTEAFRDPTPPMNTNHILLPKKGTTLLCSSSKNKPSIIGKQYTEFSGALLYALNAGSKETSQKLTLDEVAHLVWKYLDEIKSDAPRPEVHSPDQSQGNIACISFFPNPAAGNHSVAPQPLAHTPTETPRAINIFYSYAKEDAYYASELRKHLILLQRAGHINNWHPNETAPGQEPNAQTKHQLKNSQIILLLVSPDFVFYKDPSIEDNIEMEIIKERRKEGAIIIPIYIREIDWHLFPFRNLVILPRSKKPISEWSHKDKAFVEIAQEIRKTVDRIKNQQNTI